MAEIFISYARKDKGFVRDLHAALQKVNRDTWVDWRSIPESAKCGPRSLPLSKPLTTSCLSSARIPLSRGCAARKSPTLLPPTSGFSPSFITRLSARSYILRSRKFNGLIIRNWVPGRRSSDYLKRSIPILNGSTNTLSSCSERRGGNPGVVILRTLAGHSNDVNGVALSGDGRLAVSASDDQTLKVWEAESGRELRTLLGHIGSVDGVVLSGNGRLAISASRDKTLKVWEVESGRELRTLAGHSNDVNGVALRGDGRLAVSASADKTLKVWGVESGRELRTLAGHSEGVWGVALSGDGRLAVSASKDKTLKVWEVQSGRELINLAGHPKGIYSVAWSADGKVLVSGGRRHHPSLCHGH
jgi:WD40 repeat protein